jgi:aminoglycoside phosphotransferase (APT) family kinase protein
VNQAERHKRLSGYLVEPLQATGGVSITAEHRIAMGQSRAMYILDLEYSDVSGPRTRRVVARVEQHGHLGSDSRDEVAGMRALHASGFPVANVIAYEESDALLGQPFFVMDFVEGVSTWSEDTADEYVLRLHELHSLPIDDIDFLEPVSDGKGAALQEVERWYNTYHTHIVDEPSPLLEEAAQYLRNRAPDNDRVTLVHGDPGPGNYLHHEGRITALVDWEFIHLGDPYDDWAYLIWMRGAHALTEDQWIEKIEAIAGYRLDLERLHYWKAVNFLMGVCIDQTSHRIYVDGSNPAPNLLAIATGVHLSALKRLCDTVFD